MYQFLKTFLLSFLFIFHLNGQYNTQQNLHPLKKKLLITACVCSGTAYTTLLLQKAGLNINHETLSKDGCVGWMTAIDTDYGKWGYRFPSKKIEFETIFHQVRNPIHVITSHYNFCALPITDPKEDASWNKFWKYVCYYIPEIKIDEPLLVRCAKYWYYWNLAAEKRAEWTYRIEDMDNIFEEMGNRLHLSFDKSALKNLSKKTNHHKRRVSFKASWALLEKELDPELFENIQNLALRYGYEITD